MSSPANARAAEELNVSPEAPAADVANVFLDLLAANDFLPSSESVAAANRLGGLALPVGAEVEDAWREDVETFSRRYWSLSPAERTAEWQKLEATMPAEAPADRLQGLEAGLEVVAAPHTDPATEELLAAVRDLYVLVPRERAVRRNEWLLANAYRHPELVKVAAKIRTAQPEQAALEPALFLALTVGFRVDEFDKAATAEPRSDRASDAIEPIVYTPPAVAVPSPVPTLPDTTPSTKPRASSGASETGGWKAGAWGVFVVLMVIRLAAALSRGTSPTPPANYHPPAYESPNQSDSLRSNQDAINAFKKLQERQNQNSGNNKLLPSTSSYSTIDVMRFKAYENRGTGQAPPRYEDWRAEGRPEANPALDR